MATTITWNNTIKQQFDDFSISHMKQITGNALKLDDYESVKTWAGQIWDQVSNDFMPPGDPWTQPQKDNFQTWMNNGMPLGDSVADGSGGTGGGGGAANITWTNTIKGQFTQLDINHMKQVSGGDIDLGSYDSVKANAKPIFTRVSNKTMPPGKPWSAAWITNFQIWKDNGMPLGDAAADRSTGTGSGGATKITWTNTIKGQFTQLDINHMKQVTGGDIDLSSYASVKANGKPIFTRVSNKTMPPGNPWSATFIANFKAWMDAGYPET